MPEIFQGTDVPVWLQRITQPPNAGAIGRDIGGVLAGVVNSLGDDESAAGGGDYWGTRKGLEQGMQEARLNEADPMWRLKKTQIEAHVKDALAQAESRHALAQQHSNETSAWIAAIPRLAPWKAATPEERAVMATPDVGPSKTAWKVIQDQQNADWRYDIQKEHNELARMRAENTAAEAKILVQNSKLFSDQLSMLKDPAAVAAIMRLRPDGQAGPTPEQYVALKEALAAQEKSVAATTEGMDKTTKVGPKGQVSTTYTTPKSPELIKLQKGLIDAIGRGDEVSASEIQDEINGVEAKELENLRQKNRMELEKTRAANRGASSPLGKLIDDRNKAAAKGEMDDVHLYQNAIDATKKGEPIMRTYKGQTVLFMPGSSNLHFLKDPEMESEAKVLNKEFDANLRDISEARKSLVTKKLVPELEKKAEATKAKITSLFKRAEATQAQPEPEPAPAAAAPTNAPAPAASSPYKVGARYGDLRYLGGDWTLESSWEKIK